MGSSKVNKSICLSFPSEVEYEKLVKDKKGFKTYLNKAYQQNRELFPKQMDSGFKFNGYVESKKQLVMKLAQEYDDATTQITKYADRPQLVEDLKNQQKTLKDRMKLEASFIPEYELPERVKYIISH